MQDRHIYRGINQDGGWVTGSAVWYSETACDICEDKDTFWAVDVETVGQCTGLKDKNGMLIFEGDILKIDNAYYPNKGYFTYKQVLFNFPVLSIKYLYDENGKNHLCGNTAPLTVFNCGEHYEIIGNMHENKELLRER